MQAQKRISHGARPTRLKHTDYDFLKSHRFAGGTPEFKDEYFADAGLTMPDQNHVCSEFVPPTPPMPFGCTNFIQADLATDLTRRMHNPLFLENITHANAKGGLDIRDSLDACTPPTTLKPCRLGWITQFFNVRSQGRIDFFDAFRIAQVMGVNAGEHRSITWGTPWFPSWEESINNGLRVMPMPTTQELAQIRKNFLSMPWHNSKLDGWTTNNGVLLYRDKSLQGPDIGDHGFIYFPREVINMVMSLKYTIAFTASNIGVEKPLPIDVNTVQWIVSFLRTLLSRYVFGSYARK